MDERALTTIKDAGFRSIRALGESRWGLKRGNQPFTLVLKTAPDARAETLEGLLASAALIASKTSQPGTRPMAIIFAPKLTKRMRSRLQDFAERYLPEGLTWGWLDRNGGLELRGFVERPPTRDKPVAASIRAGAATPYISFRSDVNQWLLKVLMAKRIPGEWLTAPRDQAPFESDVELAEVAGVSAASVSKLVRPARALGLLLNGFELVLTRQWMTTWANANAAWTTEVPCRFLTPRRDPLNTIRARFASLDDELGPVSVGGHAAADLLGFGHVKGLPPHLVCKEVSKNVFDHFQLRPVEPGEVAEVIVRKALFPRSTFEGRVQVDGVPVTDIIQTWLDVGHRSARGAEQAEHIWNRCLSAVLEPQN
jgi:hypothetical protein